ncbi:hypothetical protein NKG94_42855 [Micromonospora sp. M12]
MTDLKPGVLLLIGEACSVQFAGDRAVRLRLVSVDPRPTYHGWVWLTGYVLNGKGVAVDKREVFVQRTGCGYCAPHPARARRPTRSAADRLAFRPHLAARTQDWCQETPRWVLKRRHRVGATLSVGHHAFIRRCVVVRIPSLSRRSEPAPPRDESPTRDENLDGRVDGRDTRSPTRSGRTTALAARWSPTGTPTRRRTAAPVPPAANSARPSAVPASGRRWPEPQPRGRWTAIPAPPGRWTPRPAPRGPRTPRPAPTDRWTPSPDRPTGGHRRPHRADGHRGRHRLDHGSRRRAGCRPGQHHPAI